MFSTSSTRTDSMDQDTSLRPRADAPGLQAPAWNALALASPDAALSALLEGRAAAFDLEVATLVAVWRRATPPAQQRFLDELASHWESADFTWLWTRLRAAEPEGAGTRRARTGRSLPARAPSTRLPAPARRRTRPYAA